MQAALFGIRQKFDDVQHMSTDEFGGKLEQSPEQYCILDCREPNEYKVSHLPGAIQVDPAVTGDEVKNLKIPTDKQIVCYCSIGYRSSLVAREITMFMNKENMDPKAVWNLEGSIFKWANEGRPMVDEAGQTTPFVHPYNAAWGLLVNSELRKYDTDSQADAQ